jgi:predicted permease
VLTLALAIGANTAIYTVVNALLLRPLPGVQHPGQLVTLKRLQLNNPDYVFGYPDYVDYRSRTTTFSGLAAHIRWPLILSTTGERLRADLVSDNYFRVLGVQPTVGRLLDSGAEAVLSYGFWQRSFAADAAVVGSAIQLGGYTYTIMGVAGRSFLGTVPGAPVDVWIPLAMQPAAIPRLSADILQSRTAGWLNVFGRLRPGASLDQARAELKTVAAHMAQAYPRTNEHRGVDVLPGVGLDPDDKAVLAAFFRLLLGAVGALLLIACANVAGLTVIRATARRKEMAIRRAIGASPRQIVTQLLTEGLLVSLFAGLAG